MRFVRHRFEKRRSDEGMDLLNLIFPPRCPLCGEILTLEEGKVHRSCYEKLPWIREPRCRRCGKPIADAAGEFCLVLFPEQVGSRKKL